MSARRRARRAVTLAVLVAAGAGWPASSGAQAVGGARERFGRAVVQREEARRREAFDDAFRTYSKRWFGIGYDWRVFKAQGMAESDLTPTAKSRVGARGIMQLMPGTFAQIRAARPEFRSIEDPRWNIAAGIMHDRYLWTLFPKMDEEERRRFMFAAYNAGEGTIKRARSVAEARRLNAARWSQIETVAPEVQRWRYRETLGYVRRIEENHRALLTAPDAADSRGALAEALRRRAALADSSRRAQP